MDFLEAFIQFFTDLFSALAAFLGNDSFTSLVDGIGEISNIVDDATAENKTTTA